MTPTTQTPTETHSLTHGKAVRKEIAQSFFAGQLWFIVRNILGWVLILASPAVGFLPGPGGILVFILGFALASIPGKRRLTSRVMRGRPLRVGPGPLILLTTLMAAVLCVLIVIAFSHYFDRIVNWLGVVGTDTEQRELARLLIGVCILAVPVSWVSVRLSLLLVNFALRAMPLGRRYIRPWLRKRGISFLPPRRKRVGIDGTNENEILTISEDGRRQVKQTGRWALRWVRRAVPIALISYIFVGVVHPVIRDWSDVREDLGDIAPVSAIVSVAMFAGFLWFIRSVSWRLILRGLGYEIPAAASARIWISSEMARYIPGSIWQIVGRAALAKPYGVRATVSSTSQIYEISIFLTANILVAVGGLMAIGVRNFEGAADRWFWAGLIAVPLLALWLHPKIYYGLANRVLKLIGKEPITLRLGVHDVLLLLLRAMLGLAIQGLAIWLLLRGPLQLNLADAWIVASAYSLAWTAGFMVAIGAPGGIGVREAVLIAALGVALPPEVKTHLDSPATLGALALVLRLWTVAAEMLFFAIAALADQSRPEAPAGVTGTTVNGSTPSS